MKKQTIVVKLGTSVLTAGSNRLNRARMVEIVRQCALVLQAGHRVVLVTSGAVAAGREHLNFPKLEATMPNKQMLAAVGQGRLIELWEQLFSIYGLTTGQMLLTRADLEDRERFLNARDMLMTLLEHGIVPVINENDAVATSEIKVGDNDNLSALAAILAEADVLVLLTDQPGLFTADPRSDAHAKLICEVAQIDDGIRCIAGGSVSGLGTGGMSTKIQAAEVATRAGVTVVIAAGSQPENIAGVLEGRSVGTRFLPSSNPLENRKRWIFGAPPAGVLHVDAGAVTALRQKGSSLLPKGICTISGTFARGAVVKVVSPDGSDVAHGVTRYNSEDLHRIAGKQSGEIARILGYEYGPNAVHRDELILTSG